MRFLFAVPESEKDFDNPKYKWRRLFSESLGTFLLVLVACGADTVDAVSEGQIGRAAIFTAPGLMVMAIILFMGKVSGAHINPTVTIGFAARGDFPWLRVPGYLLAQSAGAVLACLLLAVLFGQSNLAPTITAPGQDFTAVQALIMETVLTFGLVSVVLGTASKAQNVGPLSALAVGLHRARGPIGQPGQRSIHESGAIPRTGLCTGEFRICLDISYRTDRWQHTGGPCGRSAARTWRR